MKPASFFAGIRAAFMVGVLCLLQASCGIGSYSKQRPNLVFVYMDQMRLHSLGFLGEDHVFTPNLDLFSLEAQYMTNAISNVPASSAYRSMLMTGRFPLSTGITGNLYPTHDFGLSKEELGFGRVLKGAGYQTAYIGKWHLENPKMLPPVSDLEYHIGRGETVDGPVLHGFDYVLQAIRPQGHTEASYLENNKQILLTGRSIDFKTEKAIEFIRNRKAGKPFALFLSYGTPNQNHVIPDQYLSLYEGSVHTTRINHPAGLTPQDVTYHFARISWCDDNFGRLLETLRKEELENNTIVVFSSAHGELLGSHGIYHENAYWYEESIKIPFLLRWPEKVPAGGNRMLLPAYDVMPTLLGMMNIRIPSSVEGTDLSENVFTKSSNGQESAFIAHYPYMAYNIPWVRVMPRNVVVNQGLARIGHGYGDLSQLGFRGVTTGRYTYVIDRCPVDEPGVSLNWREWNPGMHYIREGKTRITEFFYDGKKDPWQLHPIPLNSPEYTEVVADLRSKLKAWLLQTHDPFIPGKLD